MTVVSRWEAQRDRLMNGNGCRTVDGKTYILLDRPSIPFPWAHGFEINDEPDQDGMIEMATIEWDINYPADELGSPRVKRTDMYNIAQTY